MRTLDFSGLASPPRVSVLGETASVFYAQYWLNQIGIETSPTEDSQVIVEAGRPAGPSPLDPPIGGITRITLWDFQQGWDGNGLHAAAAA